MILQPSPKRAVSMMTDRPRISFEFFPPKSDEGKNKLQITLDQLQLLNPEYISVTFGAGGSTQDGTIETIRTILAANVEAAPHLSCIGSTKESIAALLKTYMEMGVKRIVALRGDMPSGMREAGAFLYANELVSFIRETTGDHFHIEVAAYPEFHPQAPNAKKDLDNFARKVNSGANAAITQYFYNLDAYLHFRDECDKRSVNIPIIPGIMPITNIKQLARFSEMCGADIPRWLRLHLESYGDDSQSLRVFGEEFVTRFCENLLEEGAPGLHFYTMNQVNPTAAIIQNLFSR